MATSRGSGRGWGRAWVGWGGFKCRARARRCTSSSWSETEPSSARTSSIEMVLCTGLVDAKNAPDAVRARGDDAEQVDAARAADDGKERRRPPRTCVGSFGSMTPGEFCWMFAIPSKEMEGGVLRSGCCCWRAPRGGGRSTDAAMPRGPLGRARGGREIPRREPWGGTRSEKESVMVLGPMAREPVPAGTR